MSSFLSGERPSKPPEEWWVTRAEGEEGEFQSMVSRIGMRSERDFNDSFNTAVVVDGVWKQIRGRVKILLWHDEDREGLMERIEAAGLRRVSQKELDAYEQLPEKVVAGMKFKISAEKPAKSDVQSVVPPPSPSMISPHDHTDEDDRNAVMQMDDDGGPTS
jgi:hypothetical protein